MATSTQTKAIALVAGIAASVGVYKMIVPSDQNVVHVKTTQELYEAYRLAETQNITKIEIDAPVLYLDSGMRVTGKIFSKSKKLITDGNGCLIQLNSDTIKRALYRLPKDQIEALNVFQSQGIVFENMTIIGKGKGIGIYYGAGYGGGVRNCNFENLGTAVRFEFVLMGFIDQCLATNCREYGFVFANGSWSGAGLSNAQSNHSKGTQLRVFNYHTGVTAAFATFGASGITFDQCISEGGKPKYHYLYNALQSTVCKDHHLRSIHIESDCDSAGVKIIAFGGIIWIEDVWSQKGMVLVDAQGSTGYPHIHVNGVPWVLSNTKFKRNGTNDVWIFDDIMATPNVNDTSRWVGGLKPYYWSAMNYTQAQDWTYSGLKMNGKSPVTQ